MVTSQWWDSYDRDYPLWRPGDVPPPQLLDFVVDDWEPRGLERPPGGHLWVPARQTKSPFMRFLWRERHHTGALSGHNILRELMKPTYLSLMALSAATMLLVGCNQNVPASNPPSGDTTTIVPVPVPTPEVVPVPGPPGPPGPQGPPGPEGPPAPQ
jgi:hypothetical protein